MLKDVFQLNFSTGAISAAQGRVTEYLADTHTQIHDTVKASKLIMADETSHQRNNDKRWMWAALSNNVAFLHISEHSDQSFRDYPITHFGIIRSLIPRLSDHF